MTDSRLPENLLFPKPCRKKVDRKWVKQALGKFVGACSAAATAAVVSIAVSQSPLKAQQDSKPGRLVVNQISTTQPASCPASQPASQPTTQSSQLSPQQKADAEKLVEKLDADQVATRDAATKQLKEMGQPVVAYLKDVSANRKLSSEASARVQSIIESFNPPADNPPPVKHVTMMGAVAPARIQPPPPEEK